MIKTPFETQIEEAAEKAGGLLRSRYGLWALGGISFTESALPLPLVTDPFLVAYILADRTAFWRGLVVTIITSVIGGVFAYAAAFVFYEFLMANYLTGRIGAEFLTIAEEFKRGTFVVTILGTLTPIPYTIVAMAAGFVKANLLVFALASLVGRTIRYGIVGYLTYQYGEKALEIARRHTLFATLVLFAAALLYLYLKH